MARRLELADYEFKTTMITMLRTIEEKIDNMQKQMVHVSRDGNSKKEQKMLGIKNTVMNEEQY